MISRYEIPKAERDQVASEIHQCGIRHREFERFIATPESLSGTVTEFGKALWAA